MGLDIGDKRIGIAISDPTEMLASPFKIISRNSEEQSVRELSDLIIQNDIKKIVIGLPYSLDGSLGEQSIKTISYVDKLKIITNIEIVFVDERLSSISAKKLMNAANRKKTKNKIFVDSAAAAVILQGFLDRK
jgi:putative Holliday junction resolvase